MPTFRVAPHDSSPQATPPPPLDATLLVDCSGDLQLRLNGTLILWLTTGGKLARGYQSPRELRALGLTPGSSEGLTSGIALAW